MRTKSCPSNSTLPPSGSSSAPRICISVLLPEPERPSMAINSPRRIDKSTPLSTSTLLSCLLRRRQLGDKLRQLFRRWAFRRADVKPAGGNAGAKAFLQTKPQHLAQAKAGVEVISRAGADLRLLHEGAGELSGRALD